MLRQQLLLALREEQARRLFFLVALALPSERRKNFRRELMQSGIVRFGAERRLDMRQRVVWFRRMEKRCGKLRFDRRTLRTSVDCRAQEPRGLFVVARCPRSRRLADERIAFERLPPARGRVVDLR